jgi:uncharacterized Zn finger protein
MKRCTKCGSTKKERIESHWEEDHRSSVVRKVITYRCKDCGQVYEVKRGR